jgi:hypothetical protein
MVEPQFPDRLKRPVIKKVFKESKGMLLDSYFDNQRTLPAHQDIFAKNCCRCRCTADGSLPG